MGWFMLFVLSSGLLGQHLEAPPRDLASLLDPRAALQQMGAPADEAALIALLTGDAAPAPGEAALMKAVADLAAADFKTRRNAAEVLKAAGASARPFLEGAAKSDDPEVGLTARRLLEELEETAEAKERTDTEYVKKLMAVRLLQKTKSQAALATLKKLTTTDDLTLADAAREAVAVIEGRPAARPSGQDALKAICEKLPADVAFLALMDFERGAKAQDLAELLDVVEKALKAPAVAPLMGMMGTDADPHMILDALLPQVRTGVIDLLAATGNIRVDAIAMVIPDNVTDSPHRFYTAWVLKGLWDPKRLAALCETNRTFREKKREVAGHTLYVDRNDGGVCILDEHTMVLAAFPRTGVRLDDLIRSLASEQTRALPAVPAQALETIKNPDVRIAVASSQPLAPEWAAEGRRELPGDIQRTQVRPDFARRPDRQLEVAAMQVVLAALDVEQLVGHVTTKGEVVLHGTSRDDAAAEALDAALKAVDDRLRAGSTAHTDGMPDAIRTLMEELAKKALWTTERNGKQVILRADVLKNVNVLPLLLIHAQVGHGHAVPHPAREQWDWEMVLPPMAVPPAPVPKQGG